MAKNTDIIDNQNKITKINAMQTTTFRYKLQYNNSFISTITILFVAFFISLWLLFFWSVIFTIIGFGGVIIFLIFWNMKIDGQFQIHSVETQRILESVDLEIKENIKSIHIGWNYAFVHHGKTLTLTPVADFSSERKVPDNTNQKVVFLELENGQNVVLIKELLPWQQTGNLPYIGNLVDTKTIDHLVYVKGSFKKLHQCFE